MTQTLVSVDLDWLNGATDCLRKIRNVLGYIPRTTPAVITVEHHEFLPQLRRWVKTGIVRPPFDILNLDEHHDFYINVEPYHPEGDKVNCGVWGYRIPIEWYRRYTWVHNDYGEFYDWPEVETWFEDHGIHHSERSRHRLSELRAKIAAAVFCVSPDYLHQDVADQMDRVVETVVNHFGLKRAPVRKKDWHPCELDAWYMAPRPLRVKS